MFKKITALLLLTTFTNVYAFTPVENVMGAELNKTFNNLNYSLNVEWDQKDAKFFEQTMANFEGEIANLQDAGLTKQELMNYTLDKIKDESIKRDINELATIINESQMTDQEARAFTISKLNSTYSNGASWSGSRMGLHAAIIVGAIVVILVVCHNRHNNDTPPVQEKPKCRDHKKDDLVQVGTFDFSSYNRECYDQPSFL